MSRHKFQTFYDILDLEEPTLEELQSSEEYYDDILSLEDSIEFKDSGRY